MKLFQHNGEGGAFSFHLTFRTVRGVESNAHWAATLEQIAEVSELIKQDKIGPLDCDVEDSYIIDMAKLFRSALSAIGLPMKATRYYFTELRYYASGSLGRSAFVSLERSAFVRFYDKDRKMEAHVQPGLIDFYHHDTNVHLILTIDPHFNKERYHETASGT